jgi:hypothetical protein
MRFNMASLRWVGSAFVAILLIAPAPAQEFHDLFNGKDLDGWVAEGAKEYKVDGQVKPVWTVQDGLLSCAGSGYGFLRYDKKVFDNFVLHVEYRMHPGTRMCNSGIGIRTTAFDPRMSQETRPSYFGYEVQLLDDAGKPADKHSSGSLYRYVAPKTNPVRAGPEWNSIDIECNGPRIRITINGEEVINVDQSKIDEIKKKPLKGYVCLQNHGGKIDFRNVRVSEIKKPAAKPKKQ